MAAEAGGFVRLESTNPNFLWLVDRDPNSATNGQLIRTNNPGAPRQLQLGVRFLF